MAIKTHEMIPSASPEELERVLQSLAYEWGDDLDSLQVKQLTGAMTNEIFEIIWPAKNGHLMRKVLVRVYGKGVDNFFNRDDEIRTFECMSRLGQGPRLLGRFADGRVEEFLHARTLSAADLRDPVISALIAAKMREFHNLDMPGSRNVLLWDTMRNWLGKAKSLCSPTDSKEFCLNSLGEEIKLLEQELPRDHQEIGFCHNDLQYGNIMIDEETDMLTIIDYEYACYNPVAFDLANHFCEIVANYHSDTPHVLDYSAYPGLQVRQRFVRLYLSSAGNQPDESEVNQLVCDVERYTLANHMFWGLWGLISAYVSKIDFDYKEYARQRFKQYWLRKPTLSGLSTMPLSVS